MAVWEARPVADVPAVRLARWRVYEVADTGHRHSAGRNLGQKTGRVSTAITAYDATAHRGCAQSGRVYEHIGAPALEPDADAEYVYAATPPSALH